jgi:hypothetical protein
MDFGLPQIGEFFVAAVFQNQGFTAVADDNQIGMTNFRFFHGSTMAQKQHAT